MLEAITRKMEVNLRTCWRWIELWYLAYALLGASAAGLVPILLLLAVHEGSGTAYVGWVMAFTFGGLTALSGVAWPIAIVYTGGWQLAAVW
jgi:hypothetical protein